MKPLTRTCSVASLLLTLFVSPEFQRCEAADQLHVTGGKLTRIPYVFKETSFQGRFNEAMDEAKDYDVVPMDELLYHCHNDPSEIYERLKPYVNDPSDGVKYTIIYACRFYPFNPQALKFLTKLVPDYNLTEPATNIFYQDYTSRQIVEKGGPSLKHALFQAVFHNRYVTYAYLLLTCFKKDPAVDRFLERRRKTFTIAKVWKDPMSPPDRIASNVTADAPRDTIREAVSLTWR